MEKSIVINVAFNIANPLHDEILKASWEIKERYHSDWYMDDKRFFLHLCMYLFTIPERNRSKIIEVGEEYSKYISKVRIKSKGLIVGSGNLVILDFEHNADLYKFHIKSLELFNPLREGTLRDKYNDKEYFKCLPLDDQKKLTKYGHIYVLERFHPHITIARLDSEEKCNEVVKQYSKKLKNKDSEITRLQIHEAIFVPENKNILLVDKKLRI